MFSRQAGRTISIVSLMRAGGAVMGVDNSRRLVRNQKSGIESYARSGKMTVFLDSPGSSLGRMRNPLS